MKVRLYRGPGSGKVLEWSGGDMLVWCGPKKMSRQQRYEWMRSEYSTGPFATSSSNYPMVRAVYQMKRLHTPYGSMPFPHPDGSIWFEWDGKK